MRPISTLLGKSRPALLPIQARHSTSLSIPRPRRPRPVPYHLLKPSPIASSSKYTLDDVFLPPPEQSDPVVSSLQYATDAELYHALLSPYSPEVHDHLPPHLRPYAKRASASHAEWTTSIDPSYAFLALRERSTYRQLLDYIGPCLERIYQTLQRSGMHEILASDIHLHHRNPRVLGSLLEVAAGSDPKRPLRSNMIISLYAAMQKGTTSWVSPQLGGEGLKMVIRALIKSKENFDLLQQAWEEIFAMSRREDPPWAIYSIPLHLADWGHLDVAVEQVNRIREAMHTPHSPRRPISESSSEARHMAIMKTCLHAALRLQYQTASQRATGKIVHLCRDTGLDEQASQLVFRACQHALLGRIPKRVEWAKRMIIAILALPNTPRLARSLLDAYFDVVSVNDARDLFMRLSEHPPLIPQQILHLATADLSTDAVLALLREIDRQKPGEFDNARPTFLLRLAEKKHRTIIRELYRQWEDGLEVTAPLMMRLVTRFEGGAGNREFARGILEKFKAQSPPSTVTTVALAFAHNVWKEPDEALALLRTIPKDDASVRGLMDDSRQYQPQAAYRTLFQAQHIGLSVESPIKTVIAACVRSDWRGCVPIYDYISQDDQRIMRMLHVIRLGRFGKVAKELQWYSTTSERTVDLHRTIFFRALGVDKYRTSLEVLQSIPADMLGSKLRSGMSLALARQILTAGRGVQTGNDPLIPELLQVLRSDKWTELKEFVIDERRAQAKWEKRDKLDIRDLFKDTDRMHARLERLRAAWRSDPGELERQAEARKAARARQAGTGVYGRVSRARAAETGEESFALKSGRTFDGEVDVEPAGPGLQRAAYGNTDTHPTSLGPGGIDVDPKKTGPIHHRGLDDAEGKELEHSYGVERARALERSERKDGSRDEIISYGKIVEDEPVVRASE